MKESSCSKWRNRMLRSRGPSTVWNWTIPFGDPRSHSLGLFQSDEVWHDCRCKKSSARGGARHEWGPTLGLLFTRLDWHPACAQDYTYVCTKFGVIEETTVWTVSVALRVPAHSFSQCQIELTSFGCDRRIDDSLLCKRDWVLVTLSYSKQPGQIHST